MKRKKLSTILEQTMIFICIALAVLGFIMSYVNKIKEGYHESFNYSLFITYIIYTVIIAFILYVVSRFAELSEERNALMDKGVNGPKEDEIEKNPNE